MADGTQDVEQLVDLVPFDVQLPGESPDGDGGGLGFALPFLLGMNRIGHYVPPHYSRVRDVVLVDLVRNTDPLKIAVNTFISKCCTVPLLIQPLDESVPQHVSMAETMMSGIMENSGLRRGFYVEFRKFIWDFLTTDNGAFALVLAPGSVANPIVGRVAGILHLSTTRCTRTSNPEFPVVYYHTDNRKYRIHYTRVITMANLPSGEPELKGVGFCPISLCLDAARELSDITTFMQEKLGSRPPRSILYAKTGATVAQLQSAVDLYQQRLDSEGLTRFAKTILLAPKIPGAKLELDQIDLAQVPDGFNRQETTLLAMALVAASFGLDLRDLAYSFGISGQTKSDAEIQHIKGLGKGVAEFTDEFAKQLTSKCLPPYLTSFFNFIDDSQDEQAARIRSLRSTARTRDIMGGVLTVRVSREQMLRLNEITRPEFDQMELEDGRLPDGTDTDSLFFSEEPIYTELLTFSVDNPTDLTTNDPATIVEEINGNLEQCWLKLGETVNLKQRKQVRQAIGALKFLKKRCDDAVASVSQQNMQMGLTPEGELNPAEVAGQVAGGASKQGLPQPNAKAPEQGGKPKQGQAKAGGQDGNKRPPTQQPKAGKGKIRNRTRATTPRP